MDSLARFELFYRKAAPYEFVHAVQLSGENFEALSRLTSVVVVRRLLPRRLVFRDEALGREVAEIGDYIVNDMAGMCWPMDKEIFEATYASTN